MRKILIINNFITLFLLLVLIALDFVNNARVPFEKIVFFLVVLLVVSITITAVYLKRFKFSNVAIILNVILLIIITIYLSILLFVRVKNIDLSNFIIVFFADLPFIYNIFVLRKSNPSLVTEDD